MELQGLLDSKKEYMEHLCDTFAEPIVACIQRLYNESLEKPEGRGKSVLAFFQEQLGTITEWNVSRIGDEYHVAKKRSGCNYINELIKAILVTYVKIAILSNASSTDSSKVKLRVPAAENFYHRCLIICAREVWKQPYLLYHRVRSIEIQRNLNELEAIARKAIKAAIRMYIPLDQLVRDIDLEPRPFEKKNVDDAESESVQDAESESVQDAESESVQESESESVQESESESVQESESESVQEAESEPIQDAESELVQDAESELVQEAESELVQEAESEPVQEAESPEEVEKEYEEKKSIEVDTVPTSMNEDLVSCDVDKLEPPVVASSKEDDEERPKKKIILGSMLINRGRHKLLHTKRPPKSDAFF
jgi:hypothetical protein